MAAVPSVTGLAAVIIGEVLGEALFRKHLNFLGRLILWFWAV